MKEKGAAPDILVVEDSPTQAEKLKYLLEQRGYRVATAQDGDDALMKLHERSTSLIISDIIMPEMDGFTLCRKIKQRNDTKDIPVILLTSLSDPTDVLKGLECGADSFITKPYDPHHLLFRVNHVLVNSRLRNNAASTAGVELFFKGEKYFITSERRQILDLLLSTYESAVLKNEELKGLQDQLEALNEDLEKKVEERTATLFDEIEERKKAELEIRRLNEELERRVAARTAELEAANKDLESFAFSVSHDLRAPLRSIDGFSRALDEEESDRLDDTGRNYLHRVRTAAHNMSQLIDALLQLSRLTRGELDRVTVNLSALARGVADELLQGEPGRQVELVIPDGISAEGDPALLRVVVDNLLRNAWKFTSRHRTARIEFGVRQAESGPVYFMRDDGSGFDREYAGKLFTPFQRLHTTAEFPGIGIGLATVQRIIRRHGGRLWAEGEVEKGATFYFTISPE